MKNLFNKIHNAVLLAVPSLLLAGCGGGGGGGTLASGAGSGVVDGGTEPLLTVHNPEPASILLLTTGLVGIALYARKGLKAKNKK